jgi:hypothetical protein
VPEEEFINMQMSDPAGTLRILLSKKQSQAATSSECTPSDSTPSNADINSTVRQDSLMLRLTNDYARRYVLKCIEENPSSAYGHLDFLRKLYNPLTSESTMVMVLQMGSIIDQFAKAMQKKIENGTRPNTQQQAHALFYEKAQNAQAEANNFIKNAIEGNFGLKTCYENIAFYERI